MIISLPDVNIWIALAAEGHVHHVPAREWFVAQPDASVAFCRITQMGLLRLLTNSNVMEGLRGLSFRLGDLRAVACRSTAGLRYRVGPSRCRLAPTHDPGWRWAEFLTDPYLAAFAEANSYSLVTFDRGFERWPALNLTLLSSVQNR